MISNHNSMEILLNDFVRNTTYRLFPTRKPHSVLNVILYRNTTLTNKDNNKEVYRRIKWYRKRNPLKMFFTLYINYSDNFLVVETPKRLKLLKQ